MTRKCPQCGGASRLKFQAADYNRRLSRDLFDYHECDRCRFIFLEPVPENLGAYYPSDYYQIPCSQAELEATAEKYQQWKLDIVRQFADKGRLLEIGPAYGLFAYLAKRAGFDVTAIEMDSRCCTFLRETVRINVVQSSDTIAALRELPTFDVIVMWQAIEHLADPWAVLAAAAERLSANGVLILDTPNPQAFQFQVLGRRWAHLDAPRHVCLIPGSLLVGYMSELGLRPVLLTASNKGSNGFNGFGWAFSLKNFFAVRLLGSIAHFTGRVLAKLLIPIERTGGRGSTYTAAFRKEPVR